MIKLIGCEISSGVVYITKLEDFRELMENDVYHALEEYLEKEHFKYQDKLDDLISELENKEEDYNLLDVQYDDMVEQRDDLDRKNTDLELKLINLKHDIKRLTEGIDELIK